MSLDQQVRRRLVLERLPAVTHSSLRRHAWRLGPEAHAFWEKQPCGTAVEPEKMAAAFERLWAKLHREMH